MEKSLEQRIEQFELEEEAHQRKVETLLLEAGFPAADGQRAGFKVIQYTALTFIFFSDPSVRSDHLSRIAEIRRYQESLREKGIALSFYDEDPSHPYLCG